jgi:hypothetical protein
MLLDALILQLGGLAGNLPRNRIHGQASDAIVRVRCSNTRQRRITPRWLFDGN